jgi:hypothetical protein
LGKSKAKATTITPQIKNTPVRWRLDWKMPCSLPAILDELEFATVYAHNLKYLLPA